MKTCLKRPVADPEKYRTWQDKIFLKLNRDGLCDIFCFNFIKDAPLSDINQAWKTIWTGASNLF